jgi:hypothetical protein
MSGPRASESSAVNRLAVADEKIFEVAPAGQLPDEAEAQFGRSGGHGGRLDIGRDERPVGLKIDGAFLMLAGQQ